MYVMAVHHPADDGEPREGTVPMPQAGGTVITSMSRMAHCSFATPSRRSANALLGFDSTAASASSRAPCSKSKTARQRSSSRQRRARGPWFN